MKKTVLLALSLLLLSNCFAQDAMQSFFGVTPHTQKLGDLATLEFPNKPESEIEKSEAIYRLSFGDRIYIAQIARAEKNIVDKLTTNIDDSLYNAYINTVVSGMQGKLFFKKDTIIGSLPGVAFAYKGKLDTSNCYNYNYVSYLDSHIISMMLWSADSLAWKDPKITGFFNTFKLTAKAKKIRDREIADSEVNVGRIVIVSSAIIGGILLLLVVVYMLKKKSWNK